MSQQEKIHPQHKIIYDWKKAISRIDEWKQQGFEIVFTNGCFDLIHLGHVDYLFQAAQLGDKLVIGLNSDSSVTRLKGNSRPINDEAGRALILAAFSFVDAVIIFEENTPRQLIEILRPDILVKGADYQNKEIVGGEFVESIGGKVVLIPYIKGYSTTKIIHKIKK
jgi:rfaE bifunctional protein nucleotidyltransferase chain/domain